MSTRPPLVRSVPFWGLVAVSLATAGTGAYLLSDRLGSMATTLTAGTATTVDVYVGQSVAVSGAIVLGAGIVGLLLALGIAALSTLRPHAVAPAVEPSDSPHEASLDDDTEHDHGYEHGLGYTEAIVTAPADEDAPVPTR
ncbi:dinucleotide-utilizing enzyme [Microbacterium sp. HD4P20]|uniref:dinucleotide-utilizing enzyme n=1 Tax=Microbacterium sp. HD4P20 TaxID=2864874 RepID=UPI001C642681|nr:dinucleotide-utilizing enzyme [Microbacterium sp. HD4P20]MCP2637053.1 dinucleotide-utilizing enzyme [Microbacterium sp. HD4P20]